ncbi:MAG TPA: aminotransferase class V-fold PLP-dependent enzyme [Dehalococcoidia bacterium]|nr:aminotransferase class V-fold PLP-dependent enzyme [Dehalococcoidia bacterium]
MDVEAIRQQIPATQKVVYMNTGWSGPPATRVVQAIERQLERECYEGPTTRHIWEERVEVGKQARQAIARFVGATPEEISLQANTTTGINIVVNGLEFNAGDEVITCNLEHASGLVPLYYLRERSGIVLCILEIDPQASAQAILKQFEDAMTPRTKLLVLSHISYSTGVRLPLKEINRLSHAHGARVLVDGAQTMGHIALDMHDLDADFYAFPGHKWLLGPDGVGGLFIRQDLIESVRPVDVGHWATKDYDFEGHFTPATDIIQKFEMSTTNGALWAGMTEAIAMQEETGQAQIEERTLELNSLAQRQLSEIPRVRIIGPLEGETTCGLLCFSIEGLPAPQVASDLWDKYGIVCRSVRETASTRLSLHYFNTEREVEQAAAAVRELATAGVASADPALADGFPRDV